MNKNFQDMTGRELLIANATEQNNPEFRKAFMAAILAGKFQGMTPRCFEGIKAAA
jgi:hypothetical protein